MYNVKSRTCNQLERILFLMALVKCVHGYFIVSGGLYDGLMRNLGKS